MTSDTRPFPISVVIPTRNSMDKLPRHLAHHAAVFAHCAEIVHCDSESIDGSRRHVAETLRHPQLRLVNHPPGLYQSWNYAIQQCTQPFIYISTVGDQISLDGLRRLLDLAFETEADLVISPPRFVDEAGHFHAHLRWPIDHLIRNHDLKIPCIVPSHIVYAEAVLHAPDGIMGSAASCLYRTSFLKPRPFPLEFYGVSDSVWALAHVPAARCAMLPESVSTFLLHEKSYESHGLINAHIAVLIRDFLRIKLHQLINSLRISPAVPSPIPSALLHRLRNFNLIALRRARHHKKLITIRKKMGIFWFINPRAWIARCYRNHYRRLARDLALQARSELAAGSDCSHLHG